MDDESIIALYWQRDQRAITETDTKYGALCRTVASGILRDREDTEECVSDAYLAAWNAIPPRRPQRFRAYICTVVRNISVTIASPSQTSKKIIILLSLTSIQPIPSAIWSICSAKPLLMKFALNAEALWRNS